MKKIEITFDEAWEYLKDLCEVGFSKAGIAEYLGLTRGDITAFMNQNIEKRSGNVRKLPEKYHAQVIELVELLSFNKWKELEKDGKWIKRKT